MSIRVSIVEDHATYRAYLAALIGGADGFTCTGAHRTAEEALEQIPRERPHVVLLDLELPGMSGVELIPKLKERLPELEILVLTVHKDPHRIFAALETGATGYLVKPASPVRILEAIAEVRAGGAPMSSQIARLVVKAFHQRGESKRDLAMLSPREQQILELVAKGFRSREIAQELHLSDHTVSSHLYNTYAKLHVHTRAAATAKYLRLHG
jgi:DNA-binding NarL/FixJ family response regulator